MSPADPSERPGSLATLVRQVGSNTLWTAGIILLAVVLATAGVVIHHWWLE